jgi:hypothetical protein
VGSEFDSNQIHFKVVFQNALKWPGWKSQHVSNFTDTDFLVL